MKASLDLLKEYINHNAIKKGKFKLSSGKESLYYIDMRKVSLNIIGIGYIIDALDDFFVNNELYVINVAGPIAGACPIIGALFNSGRAIVKYGYMVRKQPKEHGTQQLVEGDLDKLKEGLEVVVIEDVTTTGESALHCAKAIEQEGGKIKYIISILDRLQGARDLFNKEKYEFHSLITVDDLNL